MANFFRLLPILLVFGAPLAPFAGVAQGGKVYSLASPDKRIVLQVKAGAGLLWSVTRDGKVVLAPSALGLEVRRMDMSDRVSLMMTFLKAVAKTESVNRSIAALHYKKDSVVDHFNQLTLSVGAGGVIFRAYDDGVAYRIFTNSKDSLIVMSETADFNFPSDYNAWIPYINHGRPDLYSTSFESLYEHIPLSAFKKDTLAFMPVLVDLGEGRKVGILEADLEDYPGMFIGPGKGAAAGGYAGGGAVAGLSGVNAPYPLEERQGGHNQLQSLVVRRGDFIAKVAGTRSFPWRVLVISDHDRDLLDNDMVYRLAAPSRLKDVSWVKPGKVAWDWWNDWNISHVDFRAGINTATYKYYIDFAAANHIPYILLDEGWADSKDIMKIVPEVDLPGIIEYGRQKNVGVWLWGGWLPLDQKIDEALGYYSRMGIKGFKIDFMDRDDQKMVQFYYRMAEKAAQYHLMVDFHGAYKPTGLQRTWPNVVNFEGVRGMENAKWANDDYPGYDVTIPYIRMLSGPMDYTPGAMKNYNKRNFRAINGEPMSQGTRCHQLAMYVVYEAPFSMLADNPTNYMREPESVEFIAGVPEVWDQTVALDGKVGEYVAVARRRGRDWWVGAMGDWSERDVVLDLSFLPAGNYQAEIFKDGINADRDGTDYKKETVVVNSGTKVTVHLSAGGGWVAHLRSAPVTAVLVNQVGYGVGAPKVGVVRVGDRFFVVGAAGDTVFSGKVSDGLADFSGLRRPGRYVVVVPGVGESQSFQIGSGVYSPVTAAALKGYYYQRSGLALEARYAGRWARPAGHRDTAVLVHASAVSAGRPEGTVIAAPGGWYDAGDYNKYIVNSGITMGTLMDAYEDFAGYFDTLRVGIPPVGGLGGGAGGGARGGEGQGLPDLLNEVLYNLRWMLTMQDPGDGGVYHKCTNAVFDGMVRPGVTTAPRYVVAKSTAAALDFAAVMAQASRVYSRFGRVLPGLSDSCKRAAVSAWDWAVQHPAVLYEQEAMNRKFQPAVTTGAYGDRQLDDEWFWAASELFVATKDEKYRAGVQKGLAEIPVYVPSWASVATMGDYCLLAHKSSLPAEWSGVLERRLLGFADSLLGRQSAYHTVMGGRKSDFVWGSNSVAANQGMLLVKAWLLRPEKKYLDAALDNWDYLLGRNGTGYCFVTGVGSYSPMHPHHRPSISDGIEEPVPGLLVGGPNPGRQDRQVYPSAEAELAYVDNDQAYAANEIAINWNAPLVYLGGAIAANQQKL